MLALVGSDRCGSDENGMAGMERFGTVLDCDALHGRQR